MAIQVPPMLANDHVLVSEGIDWFENNGSPTTLKQLIVK